MNKIITILFLAITFGASAIEATNKHQNNVLYGVDNIVMPNDSLVLMNTLLVDYHVDYDIAMATKNPNDIVKALHKIGLVYLKLNRYDLAANYGWRLLNVAQKHKLNDYELFAYAMLYRVHKDSGNLQQSKEIYHEYQIKLASVGNLDSFSIQTIHVETTDHESINKELSPDLKVENKTDPVNLTKLEKQASLVSGSYWYVVGLVGILGVWLILKLVVPSHKTVNKIIDVTPVTVNKEKPNRVVKEFKSITPKTTVHPQKTEQSPTPKVEIPGKGKSEPIVVVPQKEFILPKSTNFNKLSKQVEDLFKKKEISYSWSIVGGFRQFSDNSFSSFLYIFESLTKMMLHETCQTVNVNWVEVSKGLVLKIQFSQDHWIWSGANFQMWKKELIESHEIYINIESDYSNQQHTIVFKKYY